MKLTELQKYIYDNFSEAKFRLRCAELSDLYPELNFHYLKVIPQNNIFEIKILDTLEWLNRRGNGAQIIQSFIAILKNELPPAQRAEFIQQYRQKVVSEHQYLPLPIYISEQKSHQRPLEAKISITQLISLQVVANDEARRQEEARAKELERKLKEEQAKRDAPPINSAGSDPKPNEKQEPPRPTYVPPPIPIEAQKAAGEHAKLIFWGKAGMGKSTLLHYLAHQEANKPDGYIPVFVSLKAVTSLGNTENISIQEYVLEQIYKKNKEMGKALEYYATPSRETVISTTSEPKIWWLLDGLDEVGSLAPKIVAEAKNLPGKVTITSRPVDLWDLTDFKQFDLQKISFKDVEQFIHLWFNHLIQQTIPAANKTEIAQQLLTLLRENPALAKLVESPLLLFMFLFIAVDYRGGTAEVKEIAQEAKLYEPYIEKIIHSELKKIDQTPWPTPTTLQAQTTVINLLKLSFAGLGWILQTAYYAQAQNEPTEINIQQKLTTYLAHQPGLEAYVQSPNASDWLFKFWQNSGLLRPLEMNDQTYYFFVHQTFQEYGVACFLHEAWQKDPTQTWQFLAPQNKTYPYATRLHHPTWQEPVRLLAQKMSSQELEQFIKHLWQNPSPDEKYLYRDLKLMIMLLKENINKPVNSVSKVIKKIEDLNENPTNQFHKFPELLVQLGEPAFNVIEQIALKKFYSSRKFKIKPLFNELNDEETRLEALNQLALLGKNAIPIFISMIEEREKKKESRLEKNVTPQEDVHEEYINDLTPPLDNLIPYSGDGFYRKNNLVFVKDKILEIYFKLKKFFNKILLFPTKLNEKPLNRRGGITINGRGKPHYFWQKYWDPIGGQILLTIEKTLDPSALDVLIEKGYKHSNPYIRYSSWNAIRKIIKKYGIFSFNNIQNITIIEFIELMQDCALERRKDILQSVKNYIVPLLYTVLEGYTEKMPFGGYEYETEKNIQLTVVCLLCEIDDSEIISYLSNFLVKNDKNYKFRVAQDGILKSLNETGNQNLIPFFIKFIAHQNRWVRLITIQSLKLKNSQIVQQLLTVLEYEKDNQIQENIIQILGKIGDSNVLPVLGKYYETYKVEVIEAYGNIGAFQAVPTILRTLEENLEKRYEIYERATIAKLATSFHRAWDVLFNHFQQHNFAPAQLFFTDSTPPQFLEFLLFCQANLGQIKDYYKKYEYEIVEELDRSVFYNYLIKTLNVVEKDFQALNFPEIIRKYDITRYELDKIDAINKAIIIALGKIKSYYDLISTSGEVNNITRENFLIVIITIEYNHTIALLIQSLIVYQEDNLCEEIVVALGKLKSKECVPHLIVLYNQTLKKYRPNRKLLSKCVMALAEIGDNKPEVLDILLDALFKRRYFDNEEQDIFGDFLSQINFDEEYIERIIYSGYDEQSKKILRRNVNKALDLMLKKLEDTTLSESSIVTIINWLKELGDRGDKKIIDTLKLFSYQRGLKEKLKDKIIFLNGLYFLTTQRFLHLLITEGFFSYLFYFSFDLIKIKIIEALAKVGDVTVFDDLISLLKSRKYKQYHNEVKKALGEITTAVTDTSELEKVRQVLWQTRFEGDPEIAWVAYNQVVARLTELQVDELALKEPLLLSSSPAVALPPPPAVSRFTQFKGYTRDVVMLLVIVSLAIFTDALISLLSQEFQLYLPQNSIRLVLVGVFIVIVLLTALHRWLEPPQNN